MRQLLADITARRDESRAVMAAQKGDPAGFQLLYEKHRSYVYSLCLRMTHDPGLSDDLTQDIFLHVWRKIATFKGNAQFRTWLYRVTINMVLLYFRRNKAINVSLDDEVLSATERKLMEHFPPPDIDDHILLRRSLNSLKPHHRSVLMLHDVHGYRHQDISQLLGITSGASRSQLHKARVKLRMALGFPDERSKHGSLQLQHA